MNFKFLQNWIWLSYQLNFKTPFWMKWNQIIFFFLVFPSKYGTICFFVITDMVRLGLIRSGKVSHDRWNIIFISLVFLQTKRQPFFPYLIYKTPFWMKCRAAGIKYFFFSWVFPIKYGPVCFFVIADMVR